MKSVLFVCTGNTCRSPMAEGLFRKMLAGRDDVTVTSAGVGAYPGDEANPETIRILQELGIALENFASKPVSRELIDQATHVFALSDSHLQALERRFPESADKFYLISEFSPDDDMRGFDVPDPIGCGPVAYDETREILEQLLPTLLSFIDQTSKDTPST